MKSSLFIMGLAFWLNFQYTQASQTQKSKYEAELRSNNSQAAFRVTVEDDPDYNPIAEVQFNRSPATPARTQAPATGLLLMPPSNFPAQFIGLRQTIQQNHIRHNLLFIRQLPEAPWHWVVSRVVNEPEHYVFIPFN